MTQRSPDWHNSALMCDLYQFTMLQAYFDRGMNDTAIFEFFVRRLPPQRNFLIAAGLDQAIDYLTGLRFSTADLDTLRSTELFGEAFLDSLQGMHFTGDVDAVPEGTAIFGNEPLLRVTAPLAEAQFVESRLINILHYQTLIASKAARCVLAAPGKQLVDFGMRRSHGAEAAILAARASYLAGFTGTATVLAKRLFGIPVFGTMAHSFIEAHDSELAAFENFARCHRGAIVLLIDTYDTETGAERVVSLTRGLAAAGIDIHSVRLDSGDLGQLAHRVRRILDEGGQTRIGIFASGGIDELEVQRLLGEGAPIDGFGIGTSLDVSSDAPALDCAYKLQEYAGIARRKRSSGKLTWPGAKQVFRHYDRRGKLTRDVLTLVDDPQPGEALLEPVMRAGRRVAPSPTLHAIRMRVEHELRRLPEDLRSLTRHAAYPVEIAPALETLAREVDRRIDLQA
ncbi:nicotinate phosphoribosyltransferase [Steroidobacter denitrificans]|uniref:Nicotinate phosphoribosyltransferase n=1 Tax=Steroidobacter denitrificans TaxID=465721 RepID=A0A127FDG5_STEDE|nr:nicotinate phosphoribosyltransferase [Steroidobacter denitrificans]AMN48403.1 nicotinate phosphoribosyltransferase [Steroidobacter denitrificans]